MKIEENSISDTLFLMDGKAGKISPNNILEKLKYF